MKFSKLVFILCILGLMYSCSEEYVRKPKQDLTDTDFIYLEGDEFKLRNEKYFPMMLNYIVSFRNIDNEFIVSPHIDYEKIGVFETNTKQDIHNQLRGHFQLIREMGFNSIRLCFDRISYDMINEKDMAYYYNADETKYFIDRDFGKILNGLEAVLNIAKEKDLKVMLLIKAPIENKDLEDFTVKILRRFTDNPIIFSYDFMNEPLYFDKLDDRPKKDACKIVTNWAKLMDKYAPKQLLTIGFSEPIETFEWDPSILPVDFVAFHTYHPLRAKNEIYWYSTYVNKPWMIGETSLPSENDSVSYEDQAMFMKETYEYVLDCKGAGFGWWDFQEGVNGNFEAKYTGIMNHDSITTTSDGKYTIIGTIKPAAKEIFNYSEYTPKEKVRPINYYNMLGYNNIIIKGQVLNKKDNKPIEGAVIRAWNEYWNVGLNTFSDENGEFTIYSNDECVNFQISAPGMSTIKFYQKLNYAKLTDEDYDPNNLQNKEIEYHGISYVPFLKDSVYTSVFDFDENKFNKAKFEGKLQLTYLSPVGKCK